MTGSDQLLRDRDLTIEGKFQLETVTSWSESDVQQWIDDIGFPEYSSKFVGITLQLFHMMSDWVTYICF